MYSKSDMLCILINLYSEFEYLCENLGYIIVITADVI